MPAACSVEMKPQIMALGPMRAIRRVREGARAESTPIWMPSEPRFANPHSAYDAVVKPRVESGSFEAISAFRSRYAANSFSTSFVASSSETRRISDRGTPVCGASGREVGGIELGRRTDEECDGVEDVAQDELQSEVMDPEAAADPGEQTIDGPDEGQEREHVAENLACDDETEDGTFGKRVQCVHGCVLGVLATVNDDSPTCHGLLQFWHADLADRRRNTHDRGSDKVLSWDTQAYVSAQDGASDG